MDLKDKIKGVRNVENDVYRAPVRSVNVSSIPSSLGSKLPIHQTSNKQPNYSQQQPSAVQQIEKIPVSVPFIPQQNDNCMQNGNFQQVKNPFENGFSSDIQHLNKNSYEDELAGMFNENNEETEVSQNSYTSNLESIASQAYESLQQNEYADDINQNVMSESQDSTEQTQDFGSSSIDEILNENSNSQASDNKIISNASVVDEETERIRITNESDLLQSRIITFFTAYPIKQLTIIDSEISSIIPDESSDEINQSELQFTKSEFDSLVFHNCKNGYSKFISDGNIKFEMFSKPLSQNKIVIISKIDFSSLNYDFDFISELYAYIEKGKNIAIVSNIALEPFFKTVMDYLANKNVATINQPFDTNGKYNFYETENDKISKVYLLLSALKFYTVIYNPDCIVESVKYMQKAKKSIMLYNSKQASEFVNVDIISALGGQNEYNRLSVMKSFDFIFSITETKENTIKLSVTQLLSPLSKAHISKIKKIIGEDSEPDVTKIYFLNVFEKEVQL